MSAWATIEKPEPINLADIMSEGISRHLQVKKENLILDASKDGWIWIESDEGDKDLKKSDEDVKEVSELLPHRYHEENSLNNDTENDLEEEEVEHSYDIFDLLEDELTYSEQEFNNNCNWQNSDEVINKYDIVLTGKTDQSKIRSVGHNLKNDDGKVWNLKSSYRFFKSLKIYFPQLGINSKEIYNVFENDELILDRLTHILFYSMFVTRLLKKVVDVINVGADGIIFCGTLDPTYQHSTKHWPELCVIKIFKKISALSFSLSFRRKEGHVNVTKVYKKSNSLNYSLSYLYKDVHTVGGLAQKAMDNLIRARKAGVPCPQFIKLKKHVLVMSFIGKDRKPALKLKSACLTYPDFVKAYEQVKNAMKMLYEKANLIHGDMSEYNILWQDGQCYFIDFTYSISPDHDYGYYFLRGDCINVINYFGKRMPDIESAEELFTYITGFSYGDKLLLPKMQSLYKANPHILHKPTEELTDNIEKLIAVR